MNKKTNDDDNAQIFDNNRRIQRRREKNDGKNIFFQGERFSVRIKRRKSEHSPIGSHFNFLESILLSGEVLSTQQLRMYYDTQSKIRKTTFDK